MIFDKGLLKMQKKLTEIISNANLGYDFQMMADNLDKELCQFERFSWLQL